MVSVVWLALVSTRDFCLPGPVHAPSINPVAAGWFQTQEAAKTLQWQLTVSAVVASFFGAAWTLLLFSTPLRPKILHFSQTVAGCLLITHAIILFLSSRWVLGTIVLLIGTWWC